MKKMLKNFSKKIEKKIFLGILLLGTVLLLYGCNFNTELKSKKSVEKVTIGIQSSPAMALVMVAEDEGFFDQAGIDVEIKEFTAGKFALEAFLGGSLDFAVSGDVPVTLSSLKGSKFVVPAQVVKKTTNEVRVVARKDFDLDSHNAKNYFKTKKRKLSTSFGGGPEFFTFEFLEKLNIQDNEIELISQAPKDMAASLISGGVDAVAIFDPIAFIIENQMGNKAVTFTDPNIYSELYVIEAQESIKNNPEPLKKVIKGLLAAEKFTAKNPERAKEIVIKYTKLDKSTVDGIWDNFDFKVALTPELLEFWDKQIDWLKLKNKIPQGAKIPNFREILFEAPLKEISPTSVNI